MLFLPTISQRKVVRVILKSQKVFAEFIAIMKIAEGYGMHNINLNSAPYFNMSFSLSIIFKCIELNNTDYKSCFSSYFKIMTK